MKLKHVITGISVLVIILVSSFISYLDYQRNVDKYQNLESELKSLKKDKADNEDSIQELKDDLNGLIDEVNSINELISEKTNWRIPTVKIGVCVSGSWYKSWMPYQKITDKTSPQYQLINESGLIFIGEDGLLYSNDGYIGVALGSNYGQIGDKFIIQFDNKRELKVIKLDEKADKDTVNGCYHRSDNSMVEVLVDKDVAAKAYPLAINVWGDFNYSDKFNGEITNVLKVIV